MWANRWRRRKIILAEGTAWIKAWSLLLWLQNCSKYEVESLRDEAGEEEKKKATKGLEASPESVHLTLLTKHERQQELLRRSSSLE